MSPTANPLDHVRGTIGEVHDLLCSLNLLTWDARTQMPAAAAAARGKMLATLSRLSRERLLAPAFRRALTEAEGTAGDADAAAELAQVRQAVEVLGRIPEGLLEALAELKARAGESWQAARASSTFATFAPDLERMVALEHRLAEAIGYAEHPYDALVGLYEPGMTAARLQTLFAQLRDGILPLLADVRARGAEPDTRFLSERPYPEAAQRAAARHFAAAIGYDFARGRLDRSAHPFEISFTRDDVRITTRFRPDWMPMSLFGTLHEAGHGLYEQGVDPSYVRTIFTTDLQGLYAVAGASYGTHESQSRLWENLVGRSPAFWHAHYPALQGFFGEALADVGVDAFVRAINAVRPSLIRVEADELTYNLHIMLRVEIEMALLDGSLAVRDAPAAWNEKTRAYLGLEVPDDAHGCLQDIHWSTGLIGSFPTYTIGNVMSAQWLEAARAQAPAVAPALERGEVGPLRAWLTDHVYRHGRRHAPDALLERATGQRLTAGPYLAYLDAKYRQLYGV